MPDPDSTGFHYDLNDMSLTPEEEAQKFAWLRTHDPVHWDEHNQLWLISRHADVQSMLKQPELFSSEPKGPWHMFDTQFSMQAQDGVLHDAVRQVVGIGFRPRSIRQLETSVQALTDQAIDSVAKNGACDLVQDIAVPIPTAVIANLLGFEGAAIELFKRWGDAVFGSGADWGEAEHRAVKDFQDYVRDIVRQRKTEPRDDLLSAIVAANDDTITDSDGQQVSILSPFFRDPIPGMPVNDGVMGFIAFLVLAGSETTRHSISRGMHLLMTHPKERDKLIQDPGLIDSAVDEILRYTSVVRTMRRVVMRDTELHGKQLRQGDSVVYLFRSANLDERVFDNPDAFRVDRNPNDHIAFGWGSHFCLGSNLAKLEMKVVIASLLERLPDLAPDTERPVVDNANPVVSGLDALPVRFSAA